MRFEVINVNEYSGNNFCARRAAKLYENGVLEYFEEPEFEEDEEEVECATTS